MQQSFNRKAANDNKPKEERDWLWNRIKSAQKEVESWPTWMRLAHGLKLDKE